MSSLNLLFFIIWVVICVWIARRIICTNKQPDTNVFISIPQTDKNIEKLEG